MKGMLIGKETNFFEDVKTPIFAGMDFKTKNNKMRKVGYEIVRIFYDSDLNDWQVGSQRIKRIINN